MELSKENVKEMMAILLDIVDDVSDINDVTDGLKKVIKFIDEMDYSDNIKKAIVKGLSQFSKLADKLTKTKELGL